MGDRFKVGMEDRALGIYGFSVAVRSSGCRVEFLRNLVLGSRRGMTLILENENLVLVQGITDDIEVDIYVARVSLDSALEQVGAILP